MRIVEKRRLRGAGETAPVTGFGRVGPLYVAFSAKPAWRGSLAVVLEHSDDGERWAEACAYTFRTNGSRGRVDQIADPKDQLRVRWAVTGGRWDFRVDVGAAYRRGAALGLEEITEG